MLLYSSHDNPCHLVNSPSLTEGACRWPLPCPWAWIHRTATIGWLTFPCQGKEAIHYPFRGPFHSRVPAEGLRRVSPSPYGEHAAGTNVFLRTIQLNRLTLQESALPFQVWTEHSFRGVIRRPAFTPFARSRGLSHVWTSFIEFLSKWIVTDYTAFTCFGGLLVILDRGTKC